MRCPKCEFENREGAKFCKECGNRLELACPQCGIMNQLSSNFCDECGHDLTTATVPTVKPLSFDEKLDKLQRYLPKGLTEKILAQRGKIEGERRQVTVMLCDVEGFTPLSEKLGEEKIYSVADELFEMMIHKVHDYGGTVNRGRVKATNNQRDINLNEIFKCYEENRTKLFEGSIARNIGEILLNIDDRHMNEAEEWANKAIEADKRYGIMPELGFDHTLYAELLKRKGDLPGAREKLNKAIEIYKECGADGWLKKAQDALVVLEKPGQTRAPRKKKARSSPWIEAPT